MSSKRANIAIAAGMIAVVIAVVLAMSSMFFPRAKPRLVVLLPGQSAEGIDLPEQVAQTTAPTTQAAPVPLPDEIRKALLRNAAQLDPITVTWTQQNSSPLSIEQAAAVMKIAPSSAEFATREFVRFSVTFQHGKYTGRFEYLSRRFVYTANSDISSISEMSFDGQTLYNGYKFEGKQPRVLLQAPLASYSDADRENENINDEYFSLAGLGLPVRIGDLKEHRPPVAMILRLLDEKGAWLLSVDHTDLAGRRLVRLRIALPWPGQRRYIGEYDLDPRLNFALRRHEQRYDNGILITRFDCDDFQKVPGRELYLPHKCTSLQFGGGDKYFKDAIVVRTLAVTEINLDPLPDDRFVLSYKEPGTRVYINDVKGNQTAYTVQSDGTLVPVPRRRPATRTTAPSATRP